ncbi:MAG: ABC transporter ATP-binding protein [Deltaproteobacteria bacterium]|nr:ABC transporter ATP-binding protein [Deltaproteobacteria bacterium]
MIRFEKVTKSFKDQLVLNELDLDIAEGKTTVIVGRSGGGKSVLLKHAIGLIKPDSGEIFIDGKPTTKLGEFAHNELRKIFGMLFQEAALFDSMTVFENVAFPLREHTRKSAAEIATIVKERLNAVGLVRVDKKMPSELSGGMRKRVGLARALVLNPRIVLFDEPTTGLDPIMTKAINSLIIDTQRHFNLTCVVISHDVESIFEIGDDIALLYDGKIVEHSDTFSMRNSTNPLVKQFFSGSQEGPIQII